jgi:hypothetical protein
MSSSPQRLDEFDSNKPYSQAQQGSVTEVTVKRNCNHSNLDRGSRGGIRCESRVHFRFLLANHP